MFGSTSRFGWPYPTGYEPARFSTEIDVANWIQEVVEAIEETVRSNGQSILLISTTDDIPDGTPAGTLIGRF